MSFYKLLDIELGSHVYINPKSIVYYVYNDTYVEVYLHTQQYMHVDKSDFTNMMILEGVDEYWQTTLTII